ncbi:MAG TPA: quinoprotein dehydrogenase-associated SoxYZ-like carrier [Steroidobacteraceae bacterium]
MQHRNFRRLPARLRLRRLALLSLAALAPAGAALALADTPAPDGAWNYLRPQLYGERDIGVGDPALFSLEAPASTPDPAATPLTIRFGAAAIGHIKQLRVIIDNNPSPVASTFDFAGGARVTELDMRVRIDRWTSVRAIAETTDGTLEMRSSWVNASGGCSAAPSGGGTGKLGDIRFRNTPDGKALQVGIRHPNNSGFQIDPVSGNPIPPHYVSHIRFSSQGRTLLDVDAGISLSENPTLRIASDKALPEPVDIEVVDSKDAHFSASWRGPATGAETISDAAVGNR